MTDETTPLDPPTDPAAAQAPERKRTRNRTAIRRRPTARGKRSQADPLRAYPTWYQELVPRLGLRALTPRALDATLRLASVIREAGAPGSDLAQIHERLVRLESQLGHLVAAVDGILAGERFVGAPPGLGGYVPGQIPVPTTAPLATVGGPDGRTQTVRLLREADGSVSRVPAPAPHAIREEELVVAVRELRQRYGPALSKVIATGADCLRRSAAAGTPIGRPYLQWLSGYCEARLLQPGEDEEGEQSDPLLDLLAAPRVQGDQLPAEPRDEDDAEDDAEWRAADTPEQDAV